MKLLPNPLPILKENHPQNVLCSICPKPGDCCKDFRLYQKGEIKTFWKDEGIWPVFDFLRDMRLPFNPKTIDTENINEEGKAYISWLFDCPKLLPDGRCGIYDDRPVLCRRFIAGTDTLCVFGKMAIAE